MLLSMTGYGEAHLQEQGLFVGAEMRAINNRYFKLNLRTGEGFGALEPQVEALVREKVKRGTVQISLNIEREARPDDYRLNLAVLDGYRQQLAGYGKGTGTLTENVPWDVLLSLPGVADEQRHRPADVQDVWPLLEKALHAALAQLDGMRTEEGRAMERDMRENTGLITRELAAIERRAPLVVEAYRNRLTERLSGLLKEFGVTVGAADIVKEVGLFAERGDIGEEIVRLKSHLEQFAATLGERESSGRKLDFLTQEMFRETNTIGSKANDAEIAKHVIEIKAAIERLREMVQNVE